METSRKYNSLKERNIIVDEEQLKGLVMLHDNFDSDWQRSDEPHGTLVFDWPKLPTAEELAEEAKEAKIVELIAKPSRTTKESNQLIDLLANKLGYELPESKQITAIS